MTELRRRARATGDDRLFGPDALPVLRRRSRRFRTDTAQPPS